ncbi:hypothetical protein B0T24DRAFT_677044 [Lasiosphaeria ovina]|uniref:Uncharacterized protein n=1 Tax=Lasiosphaeria ovina TaxID=92902 RepID=A0AAE0N9W1_9PEZI|nr:hypothetical protein B0T24DRAFT_677044 [Lasiosphaeria ovina]
MLSRRDTVAAVLEAHNEQSVDKILVHHKSLGRAPMDMTVNDMFEDDKANKVVVWIDATADTDVGPYVNEKMLIFYFDEAGKISRSLEFIQLNGATVGELASRRWRREAVSSLLP